ncbi:unnamed protein product [Prorocentrum cordatum]|uniref:K Homology domain-containing protein n=1 Tax=Prorocentrum cordatum TaxID=2364126 RepID=A0ABN9X2S8_9DINO|nr:unnamed protein product [Polarella glacialis]
MSAVPEEPPAAKLGPVEIQGTVTAEDVDAIMEATGCKVPARGRPRTDDGTRYLTVVGPASKVEEAHRMARMYIYLHGSSGGRRKQPGPAPLSPVARRAPAPRRGGRSLSPHVQQPADGDADSQPLHVDLAADGDSRARPLRVERPDEGYVSSEPFKVDIPYDRLATSRFAPGTWCPNDNAGASSSGAPPGQGNMGEQGVLDVDTIYHRACTINPHKDEATRAEYVLSKRQVPHVPQPQDEKKTSEEGCDHVWLQEGSAPIQVPARNLDARVGWFLRGRPVSSSASASRGPTLVFFEDY